MEWAEHKMGTRNKDEAEKRLRHAVCFIFLQNCFRQIVVWEILMMCEKTKYKRVMFDHVEVEDEN